MASSPLDQFNSSVRNLSATGNFEKLNELCNKSKDILAKNANQLDDILQTFDLHEHSLGILTILVVKTDLDGAENDESLLHLIEDFIVGCNSEQVRSASDNYNDLIHCYTNFLVLKKQAIRGILYLQKAITKIQLYPSQLTSIHADLCQLCILAKCFKPALQFLGVEMTNIAKESGQFNVKYFLLYYYYGGMIYAALKKWERSLYFFEVALTTPSMAVSMIMLEAYKKYVLVSLILDGRFPSLPKYTSNIVTRFSKALSAPYKSLANAYASHDPNEVSSVIQKFFASFVADNNMGLVKQCLVSLHKKNIQRLTKTFLTLSLNDMADRVQLSSAKEAESYILRMIEDGEIFASINQKDGMVIFLDNPEKYNTAGVFRKLEEEMRTCITLDENLRKMNHEIAINPKYLQKIRIEPE